MANVLVLFALAVCVVLAARSALKNRGRCGGDCARCGMDCKHAKK